MNRENGAIDWRSVQREAAVLALLFLSYAFIFPSQLENFGSGFLGGNRGDAGIYVWTTLENIRHVLCWPSLGFDVNFFYPFGRGLAYTDSFLLPSLLAEPIYLLTSNLSIAYNTVITAAIVLNGYFAYRLSYYLLQRRVPAFFSGMTFLLLPYFAFHRGHPQLQFALFLPLTILSALRYGEKRCKLAACSLGFFALCAFCCAVYYGIYCLILTAVALGAYGLLRPGTIKIRDLFTLALLNIPWAVFLALLSMPYQEVREAFGAVPRETIKGFSPFLLAYLSAPPTNITWNSLRFLSHLEGHLFVGMTVLGLALFGIWDLLSAEKFSSNREGRPKVIVFGLFTLTMLASALAAMITARDSNWRALLISTPFWALLLYLGALLRQAGKGISDQTLSENERGLFITFLLVFFTFASLGFIGRSSVEIPGPELYKLLYFLPGANALRAVERIGIINNLSLTILAGFGLSALLQKEKIKTGRTGILATAIIFTLALYESRDRGSPIVAMPPTPQIYEKLAELPNNDPVVALPFLTMHKSVRFLNAQTEYMHWIGPDRPMVDGFSGRMPQIFSTARFDTDLGKEGITELGEIVGLRYVVVNKRLLLPDVRHHLDRQIRSSPDLHILAKDHGNYLLEIDPVLDLTTVKFPQLIMPSSKKLDRSLTFEIQIKPHAANSVSQVTLSIAVQLPHVTNYKELIVEKPDTWQQVTLDIPHTSNGVNPTRVIFNPSNFAQAQSILVRHLHLEPVPKPL